MDSYLPGTNQAAAHQLTNTSLRFQKVSPTDSRLQPYRGPIVDACIR